MTAATGALAPAAPALLVTRSRRPATWAAAVGVCGLLVLALLPFVSAIGFITDLVNLFILVSLATMWNALAGYVGLVSVGQQLYIGAGAYLVLVLSQHGWDPFAAVPVAVVGGAVLALPASWLVFRLSGAYFAIATWVLAEVGMLFVERFGSLGGGTGAPVLGLDGFGPDALLRYTYWLALGVTALVVLAVFVLLRSRLGLVLTAVRDNETGARSVGAPVMASKRVVYLLAAGGCAATGAVIAISQLDVEPSNVFNVQWTAYMIFAVLIGGLATIEGPLVGAVIFFVLQQELANYNAWYLIILGTVAMAMAIWARRGVWGVLTARLSLHFFPVGYHVHIPGPTAPGDRFSRFLRGDPPVPPADPHKEETRA
ncbi:MAG TPA: branched-chain amino acid ABC transporter permease [Acidimicrobiales bacterium]|nr:branched-chain amino acid ABC transporter permease [Acidimicrobiales bacterium]